MLLEILLTVAAAWLLLKIIALPIRLIWKLLLNTGCGFLVLMGLNWLAPYTGISFEENLLSAILIGFLGLPGVILLCVVHFVAQFGGF